MNENATEEKRINKERASTRSSYTVSHIIPHDDMTLPPTRVRAAYIHLIMCTALVTFMVSSRRLACLSE